MQGVAQAALRAVERAVAPMEMARATGGDFSRVGCRLWRGRRRRRTEAGEAGQQLTHVPCEWVRQ